jgi:hypothetical protein
MILILGNKCCNRDRLGVVLESGYKYEPLVFVSGTALGVPSNNGGTLT